VSKRDMKYSIEQVRAAIIIAMHCTNQPESWSDAIITELTRSQWKPQIRIELQKFSQAMEQKLQLNDHKEHWSDCSNEWLFHRLLEEISELYDSINQDINIADEAVDVANFAMMIADNQRVDP